MFPQDNLHCEVFTVDIRNLLTELIQEYEFVNPIVEVIPSDIGGFTSLLTRIKITSDTKRLDLILKTAVIDPNSSVVLTNTLYEREAYVYTNVLTTFGALQESIPEGMRFHTVTCYRMLNKPETKTLILDDATAEGFKLYRLGNSLDFDHFKLVIVNLARFHALSFALRETDPVAMKRFAENLIEHYTHPQYVKYIRKVWGLCCSIVDDPVDAESLKSLTDNVVQYYYDSRSTLATAPYNVVCHGDCWINNFLFKYKDGVPVEMKAIDWQGSIYSSPITDLAHFFFSSTRSEFRKQHFPDVLDIYYEALAYQLDILNCKIEKCYPKNIFMEHVYKILPYGLMTGVIALPFVIPGKDVEQKASLDDVLTAVTDDCKSEMKKLVKDFVQFRLI